MNVNHYNSATQNRNWKALGTKQAVCRKNSKWEMEVERWKAATQLLSSPPATDTSICDKGLANNIRQSESRLINMTEDWRTEVTDKGKKKH